MPEPLSYPPLPYKGVIPHVIDVEYTEKTREVPTPQDEVLDIISHCPKCGAPIYGRKTIRANSGRVPVQYSCACNPPPAGRCSHGHRFS